MMFSLELVARRSLGSARDEEDCELLLQLGDAQIKAGDFVSGERTLEGSGTACREFGVISGSRRGRHRACHRLTGCHRGHHNQLAIVLGEKSARTFGTPRNLDCAH